jgi:hypothetical protein
MAELACRLFWCTHKTLAICKISLSIIFESRTQTHEIYIAIPYRGFLEKVDRNKSHPSTLRCGRTFFVPQLSIINISSQICLNFTDPLSIVLAGREVLHDNLQGGIRLAQTEHEMTGATANIA